MKGNDFIPRQVLVPARATLLLLLGLLALVCIVNSFVKHITPDTSNYLLHARTFVHSLNGFTLSHDSKGILLTFALAPAVWAFGATMTAAAAAQLVAYGIGFVCLYFFVRSYAHVFGAWVVTLIGLCVVFSHLIWGGNARPEDFAVGYTAVALLAAWRRTPRWLAVGGGMAACCLFTKTTLVLAPGAVLIAACLCDNAAPAADSDARSARSFVGSARRLLWVGAGFALVAAVLLVWMALFDSLPQWYRQTIQWPAECSAASMFDFRSVRALLHLIWRSQLTGLFFIALLGLANGWLQGMRRLTVLTAVLLVAELVRVLLEGASWPYLLTVAIIPLLAGATLLGVHKNVAWNLSFVIWLVPLVCLLPLLRVTAIADSQALELRLSRHLPSPYEHLAAQMIAAGYRPGDSVFVNGNDYQLFLLLHAPPPAPVLPVHYPTVSPQERLATRQFYAQHHPEWVVIDENLYMAGSVVPRQFVAFKLQIRGAVDYAYHVVSPANGGLMQVSNPIEEKGFELCPILPESVTYRAVLDTGNLQVWRLVKGS